MSDRASINFDRIAPIYEQSRGGFVRGGSYAGTISAHLLPGTVVEIGIGTGSIALPMTDAGHPVVGVDLSPNMLELAHQRSHVLRERRPRHPRDATPDHRRDEQRDHGERDGA